MKYESLIFDIDGTLWDSRALVAEGYNLQLCDEGMPERCVDAARLKPLFGKKMTQIADELFPDLPEEARYALMERCMARENRYLAENVCDVGYPDIAPTLEALSRSHRLFIVSNSQCGYPELCMEKLGITRFFAGHLCFGDTGTEKGETIRTLMARYSITSAAYIGDTQGDCDAARQAGLDFIWAAYGFGTAKPYARRLDGFSELARWDAAGEL